MKEQQEVEKERSKTQKRAISDSGSNVVGRFFHKGGDLHPARAIKISRGG
jgi:hypothetical protein